MRRREDLYQLDLRKFTQALEDVRELKTTTDGANLGEYDIGITPEATIEILQDRVRETQRELDALETWRDKTTFRLEFARPVARRSARRLRQPPLNVSAFSQAIHGGSND
jgi:hypothetical protein